MYTLPGVVGQCDSVVALAKNVVAIAKSDLPILVTGESGTGKELIARAIHHCSGRKGPIVVVDCGALPPSLVEEELFGHERGCFTGATERRAGMLEQADRGTVFLDEIAELPIYLQPRLLRVMQEHSLRRIGARAETSLDVRFVSATNVNLLQAVRERKFRSDLYFRVCAFQIKSPPLRERLDDLPLLLRHFLDKFGASDRYIQSDALKVLCGYNWPGNVRELEHFVHCLIALVATGPITEAHVREQLKQHGNLDTSSVDLDPSASQNLLEQATEKAIGQAMRNSGGNVAKAATLLGMGKSTLYTKLKAERAVSTNGHGRISDVNGCDE